MRMEGGTIASFGSEVALFPLIVSADGCKQKKKKVCNWNVHEWLYFTVFR